jgi:predicted AAA+ superfamily ATPase
MDSPALNQSIVDWREYYRESLARSFSRTTNIIAPSKDVALGLVGIRRSGKTTLAIQISKDVGEGKVFYYNFEDPLFTSNSRTSDLDLLLTTAEENSLEAIELLILDEIHTVPLWEKWLRKIIDLRRYRVIVTGSSAKLMRSELATSLTGRVVVKEVWPLSLSEYVRVRKNSKSKATTARIYKEYLTYGGFPAVALENNAEQKKEFLRSYFTDILLKDVVSRNKVRNVVSLQNLATYMLTNLSSTHSSVSIEKALGLDKEAALSYLGYLSDSFLINACTLYSNNLKVQVRAAAKYYLSDLGLRLVGARSGSDDHGKLLENLVYLELRRKNSDIYFFKQQKEVDFLVCDEYQPEAAYQVSYTISDTDTRERDISALIELNKVYSVKKLFIVTWNETEVIKIGRLKIGVIPVHVLANSMRS